MSLSNFIRDHANEIAQEWETFARTCLPAASSMEDERLRDHVVELVAFIAADMDSAQSSAEQAEKAQGRGPKQNGDSVAQTHAVLRAADGFTIDQVMGEFRALRASIMRLRSNELASRWDVIELTRFNESIDQMLSESIARHTNLAAENLQRQSRQKDNFISTLSHELRNPVGAIKNCSQFLNASGMHDPNVARVAEILARQTGHLTRLLDDLLDVARISRERITLKLDIDDLRTCVQDAVDANMQPLAQHGQVVKLDMPSLPIMIRMDCTRVAQVVSNLVNNAGKFSPENSTIQVSVSREAEQVVIRVSDNGVGIDASMLSSMFDAFHENRAPKNERQGLGIGLWLSRQLVEMHGGTITAFSQGKGTGAEFCVRLPLH